MYENWKLCPDLKTGELCIVLEQYHKGHFDRKFHKHVPRRRHSLDAKLHLLKALVVRFYELEGMGVEHIIDEYLVTRKKGHLGHLQMHVSYPEPGVIRYYCGANTKAWFDEVNRPGVFRK